eukprot:scaffold9158_cov72-Cylindrotheca_fusiformis.AAC.3
MAVGMPGVTVRSTHVGRKRAEHSMTRNSNTKSAKHLECRRGAGKKERNATIPQVGRNSGSVGFSSLGRQQ